MTTDDHAKKRVYFDWTKVIFPAGTKIVKRLYLKHYHIGWDGDAKKLFVSVNISDSNLAALRTRIRRTP